MLKIGAALAALYLVTLAPAAGAESLRVVDGDTLAIGEERVRLWGIDAPELGQSCAAADGTHYDCGEAARRVLSDLIGDSEVRCEVVDQDRYGRLVARCSVGGVDVGGEMVRQGWALDYAEYSEGRYATQQREAEAARYGMWSGSFVAPWDWRR